MIKFKRLSNQIMVVFVGVILAILVLSGLAMTVLAQYILTDNIIRGQQDMAISLTDHILFELGSNLRRLNELTNKSTVKSMVPASLVAELRSFQSRNPTITSLYVADPQGQQSARSDFNRASNVATVEGFQEALQGLVYFSDLSRVALSSQYQQSGNTSLTLEWQDSIAVSVLVPIQATGEVVGILGANINLFRIQPLLENLTLTHDETVTVLSRSGTVVAHSHRKELGKLPELSAPELFKALELGLPSVPENYIDEMGRNVKGVIHPIGMQGWSIIVQTPVSELAKEVGGLWRLWALVSVGSIALAVAAAWLIATRLTRPISQLAHATEQVAMGKLTTRVETDAVNELGTLADSFNRMVSELSSTQARNQQLLDELKQAYDRIEQAVQGWRATLDTIRDLVWICDKDCQLIRVNMAFANFVGIDPKQLIGRTCHKVLPWASEVCSSCPHKHTFANKEPAIEEFFIPQQGVHFEISTSPMFNNKSEVIAVVCVARDITERKQVREELNGPQ
ncbi:cache domain-containing protein [Chloroflexota bacterium]